MKYIPVDCDSSRREGTPNPSELVWDSAGCVWEIEGIESSKVAVPKDSDSESVVEMAADNPLEEDAGEGPRRVGANS